jgi:predicted nucleotidyltransferase
MSLRNFPDDFSPKAVTAVDAQLDQICLEHGVSIPLAVESGSRAWGFPSPDSDYDCRFVFVRPVDQHVTPWPRRDVIEAPLERELDVNGWELGKAIRLLLKGNAVIIEWLRSPIVYRGQGWFRDAFLDFAERFANRDLIARHYLHLGERQRRVYFGDGKLVPQKKIFYALRPAAALRWLRLHSDQAIAPMHFPTLMDECDPPSEVMKLTADLIARKAVTHELGGGLLPAPIANFIDQEFEIARPLFEASTTILTNEARSEAERFYRETTRRCAQDGPAI